MNCAENGVVPRSNDADLDEVYDPVLGTFLGRNGEDIVPRLLKCLLTRAMMRSFGRTGDGNLSASRGQRISIRDHRASTAVVVWRVDDPHSTDASHIIDNAKLISFMSGRFLGSFFTHFRIKLAML